MDRGDTPGRGGFHAFREPPSSGTDMRRQHPIIRWDHALGRYSGLCVLRLRVHDSQITRQL